MISWRMAADPSQFYNRWATVMPVPQRRPEELAAGRERGRGRLTAMVFPRAAAHDARQASSRGVAPISKRKKKLGVLFLFFVLWLAAFSTFLRPFFAELLYASLLADGLVSPKIVKRLPRRRCSHI